MIKKGSKIVINRPLKVVDITEGPDMATVTVSVTYTNVFGQSIKDELILPRKWVSECKPPTIKRDPKYTLGTIVRIAKVTDQMLIDSGVEVGSKGIIVDNPNDGTLEVHITDIHQSWYFIADDVETWKDGE